MGVHINCLLLVLPYIFTQMPQGHGQIREVNVPELGTIQGSVLSTVPPLSSKSYISFSGIPYADPTSYTGSNRFKPSEIWNGELPKNDDGKFIADDKLTRCPQADVLEKSNTTDLSTILRKWGKRKRDEALSTALEIRGPEECLVLNVNTPRIPTNPNNPDQLLPVIVFIHGGSWAGLWSGIFGGERFLNHNVLLVTINYRLGILGSLNLEMDGAPGNAAMYDVITALKWVKKHIRHFGGNNEKITVAGQSAGAFLASHLLTSPRVIDEADNQPLIHGLIGLSGSSLNPFATCTDPLTHHLRVSQYSGCYDGTSTPDFLKIRECMVAKSIPELIAGMTEYSKNERFEGRFGMDARVPSLQNPSKLTTVKPFMVNTPFQVMQKGEQLKIPIMTGTTRHDGGFLLEDTYLQFWSRHGHTEDSLYMKNELLSDLLEGLGMEDTSGELHHALGKIYLGNAKLADDFHSKIPGLLDIHSVLIFKAPAYQLVEMHSKVNPASYYYSFQHKGLWTLDGGTIAPGGVGHIDSLFYLFKAYPLTLPLDLSVAQRFVNYWVNFAVYGNPNGDTKITTASPYNPINHAYLIIGSWFDWTGYYCKDGWANNSVELMDLRGPGDSSSTTTTQTSIVTPTTTPPSTASTHIPFTAISVTGFLVFMHILIN